MKIMESNGIQFRDSFIEMPFQEKGFNIVEAVGRFMSAINRITSRKVLNGAGKAGIVHKNFITDISRYEL